MKTYVDEKIYNFTSPREVSLNAQPKLQKKKINEVSNAFEV